MSVRTYVDKRLKVVSGGVECLDFAGYGNHAGEAGPCHERLVYLCGEILACGAHCWVAECGKNAPPTMFDNMLTPRFNIFTMILDGIDFGGAGARTRRYYFGYLAGWQFHGTVDEFWKIFRCSVEIDSDVYFQGDEDLRLVYSRARAAKQGNIYPSEAKRVPVLSQLTAECAARYDEHMALRSQAQNLAGSYIFDVAHHPSHTVGGWLCPPLVTHGMLVNANLDKIALPSEHMFIQPEPAKEGLGGDFGCCWLPLLKQMEHNREHGRKMIFMAGNSMQNNVVGAWTWYCLSSLDVPADIEVDI